MMALLMALAAAVLASCASQVAACMQVGGCNCTAVAPDLEAAALDPDVVLTSHLLHQGEWQEILHRKGDCRCCGISDPARRAKYAQQARLAMQDTNSPPQVAVITASLGPYDQPKDADQVDGSGLVDYFMFALSDFDFNRTHVDTFPYYACCDEAKVTVRAKGSIFNPALHDNDQRLSLSASKFFKVSLQWNSTMLIAYCCLPCSAGMSHVVVVSMVASMVPGMNCGNKHM
eukprot:TRINITY_DN3256_c0_g1_i3.p2 TRINITY_DN3256_c0_g1~~TRINITY_DN3256_c0_g1_i3.p2  ORF type:complete len:231 (+),score=25.94 TRINITY_DN3256_c0_g1_i3:334-1026(+)